MSRFIMKFLLIHFVSASQWDFPFGVLPLSFSVSYIPSNSSIMDGLIADYDPVFLSHDYSLTDINIFATVYCINCHLLFLLNSFTMSS